MFVSTRTRSADIFVDFAARERFLHSEVPLRNDEPWLLPFRMVGHRHHGRHLTSLRKIEVLKRLEVSRAHTHPDRSHGHGATLLSPWGCEKAHTHRERTAPGETRQTSGPVLPHSSRRSMTGSSFSS